MKNAYITFLNHCYIDTEVEMKEIYNSQHIYTLIETSFCPDIEKVRKRRSVIAWIEQLRNRQQMCTNHFDLDADLMFAKFVFLVKVMNPLICYEFLVDY